MTTLRQTLCSDDGAGLRLSLIPCACHRSAAWALLVRALILCSALHAALCLGDVASVAYAAARDSVSLESDVKAAYLYKFIGYVEWPSASFPEPDSPYVIGVAGADAVAEELARITAGRTVNNRPLKVKRIAADDSLSGIHLLFIGKGESSRQSYWLKQAQQRPILTVTEAEGALGQGSAINFRLIDERVRFDVSLNAATRNGLKLSSRLLSVAASVQGAIQ